ncbi:UNVERIFIED_CONTAM: hypothetical protein HDU68_010772 [Siphonaria sp. JEL0065]|nr:hypothetical protein HDU68_010772 [Siphonaria sp. JEL0065]
MFQQIRTLVSSSTIPRLVQPVEVSKPVIISTFRGILRQINKQRLVDEYWPASQLTESEKLSRTAGMVGLSMPRELKEEETRAGGGQTWTEIQQQHKIEQQQKE